MSHRLFFLLVITLNLPRCPQMPSPCKRDSSVCWHDIMVHLLAQSPHQAEVPDLYHLPGCQQHVSRRQVPVDQSPGLQVIHAWHDLRGEEPEADQRVLVLTRAQGVVEWPQGGQFCHLEEGKNVKKMCHPASKHLMFRRRNTAEHLTILSGCVSTTP